jgi:hypothetical protein
VYIRLWFKLDAALEILCTGMRFDRARLTLCKSGHFHHYIIMTDPKPQQQRELDLVFGNTTTTNPNFYQTMPLPKTLGDIIRSKLGEGGIKHDSGKAPMSLLSREALEQTALVLAFGADKYAAHNWRKGFQWSRPLSAAMRHLLAFQDGEDRDPESGLSHLAHAMCCIMFVLEFEKTHKELDDRWKPETK